MIDYSKLSPEQWQQHLDDLREQRRGDGSMVAVAAIAVLFSLIGGLWGWIIAGLLGVCK